MRSEFITPFQNLCAHDPFVEWSITLLNSQPAQGQILLIQLSFYHLTLFCLLPLHLESMHTHSRHRPVHDVLNIYCIEIYKTIFESGYSIYSAPYIHCYVYYYTDVFM